MKNSLRQLYVEDDRPWPVELGTADDADARGFSCLCHPELARPPKHQRRQVEASLSSSRANASNGECPIQIDTPDFTRGWTCTVVERNKVWMN